MGPQVGGPQVGGHNANEHNANESARDGEGVAGFELWGLGFRG